ncbi:ABC transporter substrate-binding protein [Laceyella sacchari]|uniref:Cobalamin-binding protein n=1 Tax=Laceyella sacchari TaxID=37482 RepID=A0ABY5U3F4_LACSH|nr:cobalamin-binding protein [Laceyella sacchari]KPC69319.1 ABC transporter substrate-binding protein [Thermoactinomyces vulgaris]UWE04169.1 cobalamin-binding protein [Laceyella sacchari]
MKRIISICPSNTEMLHFLGLREEVCGLDDFSDWPHTWQHLPRVGPDLDIDMDKVKALRPDLVIASLSVPGMEKNISQLKQAGIPTLVLNPKTLQDIAEDFVYLGDALGMPSQGRAAKQRFLQEISLIQAAIPRQTTPPRLYFEWWPKPVFTPGRKSWLTELCQLVGATNIYADHDTESVQTDWDDVAARQPDYVLVTWTGVPRERIKPAFFTSRPAWQGTPLIEKGNIHILEEGWFCRPSPRLLLGVKQVAHLLYPDRFRAPEEGDPYQDSRLRP